MLKKLLAPLVGFLFLMLATTGAFAAVDINRATQAELETVSGIGPATAGRIVAERKKSQFKDWKDVITRVKGVGEGNAAKFSAGGLTVNGETFKAPAKKDAADAKKAKADKPAAKKDAAKKDAAEAKAKPKAAAASAAK